MPATRMRLSSTLRVDSSAYRKRNWMRWSGLPARGWLQPKWRRIPKTPTSRSDLAMCYALADIDAHQDVGKLPPFLLSPEITFEPDERNYPVLVGYPGLERRVSARSH